MTDVIIPTYDAFMNPLIEALKSLGGSGSIKEINHKVAEITGLTDEQLAVPHKPEKGKPSEVDYRLGWTRTYLKKYGVIDNPTKGVWALTEMGQSIDGVNEKEVVKTYQDQLSAPGLSDDAIVERLEQWQIEATDPNHPNHGDTNLDERASRYSTITALLEKLRDQTDQFGREDATALFQTLASGQRKGKQAASENDLSELRETLLTMLYSEGKPAEKIEVASKKIDYAGPSMMGELYGWAHAEDAPLYNGCATNALQYLGNQFDTNDYDAFVAAHEQFKQVYQEHVGRLRTDLPLNLEIDKFYNVIDKVDLKADDKIGSTDEASSARRYWRITLPTDWKATLPDGTKQTHNLWEPCLKHNIAAIGFNDTKDDFQVKKFMEIRPGDGIVAFLREKVIGGIGSATSTYDDELFLERPQDQDYWQGQFWFRVGVEWQPVKINVDSLPKPVANKFLGQTIVELKESEFMAVQQLAEGQVITDTAFKSETFELLADLHADPTRKFYLEHKEEFVTYVGDPFKQLMHRVSAQLPSSITNIMETEKGLFGRILKNDFGQGGAWDYYWGAFYPKASKRTEDAQLSMWINRNLFEFGFYIGDYGTEQRTRFVRHCQQHGDTLRRILQENLLSDKRFVFGGTQNFSTAPDGSLVIQKVADWDTFFRDPASHEFDVSIVLTRTKTPLPPPAYLSLDIAQAYQLLFPLVLLVAPDDPLPAIGQYLSELEPPELDENETDVLQHPIVLLSQIAEETGFVVHQLKHWVSAIERKGQAILYGPPGTGKTYIARLLAQHLMGGGDGYYDFVQFHPAYAYEDFIQGIRPESSLDGSLTYPLKSGRFLDFINKARQCQGTSVLIIDEINRANLARVFGELMYLLEYRNDSIPLSGGGRLNIPNNVRIIGTMNTADRSIALVDHALRRRFAFLALPPNYNVLRNFHERHETGFSVDGLIYTLQKLNQTINDRHYEVGVTFFLTKNLSIEIEDIWHMEIEPYLEEYFFDQPDKVNDFRWDQVGKDILS